MPICQKCEQWKKFYDELKYRHKALENENVRQKETIRELSGKIAKLEGK